MLDAARDHVTHHTHRQWQILVHQVAWPGGRGFLAEHGPQFLQEHHVGAQRVRCRALSSSTHDVTAGFIGSHEQTRGLAQALPLSLIFDARRDSDAAALGHVDQVPRRNRDERRQARALGAERILQHLDQYFATFADQSLNIRRAALVDRQIRAAVLADRRMHDVGRVQERGALQADVDERGLHARQHARHSSLVNIADEAALVGPLQEDFLQHAVFHQGGACFARADVDEDLGRHP